MTGAGMRWERGAPYATAPHMTPLRAAWRRLQCRVFGHGAYRVPAWLLPEFVLTPAHRFCVRCGRVWS